ncbi:MAG: hypothetical protein KGH50_02345 [Candidatus Micrarchaeota archaeon]|nr:hypothetical protein [Candidatus Micrarchaeota archaeon]
MGMRVYSCEAKDAGALKQLLEYDPYLDKSKSEAELAGLKDDPNANIIFARQDYWLKDGTSLGLDRGMYYLTMSAPDEFLEKGEKKLKEGIGSLKRVEPELEAKIIATIEEERKESEQGIGLLFG